MPAPRQGRVTHTIRLAAIFALAATPALAQQSNGGISQLPSMQLQTPTPVTPPEQHLFGDWGGVRTYLGNIGIDLTFDFTSEFAGNVSGGTRQGATAANQLGLQADVDWQKLAGIPGLSTHVVLVQRSGSSDSQLFGDTLLPVQEIYGAGGDVAVHFVYGYAEESLFDKRVDLAIGRMPVLNDFAANTLYCNFMNNSLCGNPKDLPGGDVGLSSFPDATWGLRARVRPTTDTYVQAGVYEVSQGLYTYPYFRSGFQFDTSKDSGVEVPVELGYEPLVGPDKLPGHYKLGVGYDTSDYTDFYLSGAGAPALLNGEPYRRDTGKLAFWALADQMVVRNGPGATDGIIVLGAYAHQDPNVSAYADQFTAAILDHHFWQARPDDTVGLLFTYQTVSGALGKEQALDEEFGLPFANMATGIQTHEEIVEASYDISVYRGVNFEPDFQYVVRPNAQANIKNAAVLGFKLHVNF
jgi:porin